PHKNVIAGYYCRLALSERLRGDFRLSTDTSFCPAEGVRFPPRTMSCALSFVPYNFSFAPLSCRKVEPSSDTPANSPRDLEYVSISAFITISVCAAAVLPLGPAAAEASPPSFTLLFRTDSAPLGFMTRRTKSVASPPSWNPILAPSNANIAGVPQEPVKCAPERQMIAPRP